MQVQCICFREGCVVPPHYTPASSAPTDKDLILKLCLFSTQHSGGLLQSITVWLPATVSQSVSANWKEAGIGDRFMGSGANLFFQRNRLRQSYTWGGTTQAGNNVLTFFPLNCPAFVVCGHCNLCPQFCASPQHLIKLHVNN